MHGVSCEGNTNLACDATNTLPSNESCNAEKNDALSKKDNLEDETMQLEKRIERLSRNLGSFVPFFLC